MNKTYTNNVLYDTIKYHIDIISNEESFKNIALCIICIIYWLCVNSVFKIDFKFIQHFCMILIVFDILLYLLHAFLHNKNIFYHSFLYLPIF